MSEQRSQINRTPIKALIKTFRTTPTWFTIHSWSGLWLPMRWRIASDRCVSMEPSSFEPWDLSIEKKFSNQREQITHSARTCNMGTFWDVPEQSCACLVPLKTYLSPNRGLLVVVLTPQNSLADSSPLCRKLRWYSDDYPSLMKRTGYLLSWKHLNINATLSLNYLMTTDYNQHQLRDNPYQSGKGLGYGFWQSMSYERGYNLWVMTECASLKA